MVETKLANYFCILNPVSQA